MNFNTLRYLVTLAQERSFSRAAKKLFVVQPTLRQAIGILEEELGTKLYVRGSSPLMLTPAGSVFVKWAQETLKSQGNTFQKIAEMTQGSTKLVIAISYSLSMLHTSHLVSAFAPMRPNCVLHIAERNSGTIQEQMETSQEVDLMVGSLFNPAPILQSEFLCQEQLLLTMPADHPLCRGAQRIDFASLRNEPFLQLFNSRSTDIRLNTICADYGFTPKIRLQSNGYNSVLEMVNAGIGCAIIPESFVTWRNLPNVRAFPIEHPDNSRGIHMVWRKDSHISQDMAAMMDLIRQQVGHQGKQ